VTKGKSADLESAIAMPLKSAHPLFLIHVLTALGAPIALLALLAGAQGDWAMLFVWLGIALVVDGIDGPLARRYDIARRMPQWSGASLDFVIDYATYVFLPAFALAGSDMLSTPWNWICGGLVVFTGALYFADNGMKQPDGSFKGFPAGWNMVVFGLMVLSSSQVFTVLFVIALCALTFAPVRFVHPVRVARWRVLTLAVTLVWFVAAGLAIANGLSAEGVVKWLLAGSSLYLLLVSAVQQGLEALSRR
jgi:phosphatidylcholine synthase